MIRLPPFSAFSAFALFLSGCVHPVAPACAVPAAPSAGDPVAARVGDGAITLAEVDRAAGHELFELRAQALEKLIATRVLREAAGKAGESVEAYLDHQLAARVPQVTEATAREFYDKNKERLAPQLGDQDFEEVKGSLIAALTERARGEAASALVEDLKAKSGIQILLHAPRVQVAATGPRRGPDTAKVTIVEFSDFQCPYCARGEQVMEEVLKTYGPDVRLVFRDFPLPFHDHAEQAAQAGHCADDQGKFWPLHDWMFDHQQSLAAMDLKATARELGLDGAKFDQCLDSGKYAAAVAENRRAGEELGVRGTPAFFVNGTSLSGAQPFEKFKVEIDRELGRQPR